MTPPPRLATAVRVGEAGTAAAQAYMRRHGAAIAPFADLIDRFGKRAAADVVLLHQVLGAPKGKLTDAALGSGWAAAKRLFAQVQQMPAGRAKKRAGLHVQRSMLALLSRQDDFAVQWTEEITRAVLASRDAAIDKAVKLALAHGDELAEAKVLARLTADLPAASPELRALWALYLVKVKVVPNADAGLLKAARLAAKSAEEMRRLLRQRRTASRMNRLWGHLSAIRGAAGEAYALSDEAWLTIKAEEMLRAHKLAADLGPGFEVRYLTQADNQLLLNGPNREGADAAILLVNRDNREVFDVTRAQVKVANVSEGAAQSVKDVWRTVGEEKAAAFVGTPGFYTFTNANGVTESFTVAVRPEVVPRVVLLNAAGSRIPRADLEELLAMGLDVTEVGLTLTVKQLTHLAISLCESAMKNL